MSDADLVAQVLRGNRDRYTELVDRYIPMLRGLCASYVADATAQQDLVQEAFICAYEKLGALRNHDRFGAWLAKIGRNRCIDWLRRQRREHEIREQSTKSEPDARAADGLNLVVQRELRDWIHTRIALLPAKTREAMALCYVEGCSTKEAARFLGVREAAVRKRLEYGRKLLGKEMCNALGQKPSDADSGAFLRKRILLALPTAAIPVKSSAAAGVIGALGGFGVAKAAVIVFAAVAVLFGLLSQTARDSNPSRDSIAIATPPTQLDTVAATSGVGAASTPVPSEDAGSQETTDAGASYDHFFFIRHNTVNGRFDSSTLVLATVTPDDFALTDWFTREDPWSGLHPVYTGAGKIFAMTSAGEDALISIDTTSGKIDKIASPTFLCQTPGKLYEAIREGDDATIRVYDCTRLAYRDLVRVPWGSWLTRVEVSPDNRRLAYFEPDKTVLPDGRTSFRSDLLTLHVVDLQSGTVSPVSAPIYHIEPDTSSALLAAPPFLWLDDSTILVVRTALETGEPMNLVVRLDETKRYLASIDTNTGETKDLLEMPGKQMQHHVRLRPGEWDEQPVVDISNLGLFRIHVNGRSLSEYDGIGGAFRLLRTSDGHTLFDGTRILAEIQGNEDHAVSPDGRQIAWVEDRDYAGSLKPMKLRYYDADAGAVREVAEGWLELPYPGWRSWLRDDDLAAPEPALPEEGWIPFESTPWPVERPRKPDTRPDVNDYLVLDVITDADAYWLHEPVDVTVTLTNVGNQALTLLRLAVFDERTIETTVTGPGWSGLVDQIQSYLPEPEEFVLEPGQSVSANGTLEVADEGPHTIEVEYRGFQDVGSYGWRGRIQSEPVAFEILHSADDATLFAEKVERLVAKATAEFESEPDWNGANRTLEDLQVMGSDIGPDLLAFIPSVEGPGFRKLLLRPLSNIAYPESVSYFVELLKSGTPDDQSAAVQGLERLYKRYNGRERDDIAQTALIHLTTAIHMPDPEARSTLVLSLSRIKDDSIRDAFERIIDDPEESIRETAARYLAAYDGVSLADWLSQATVQPTAIQYAIAKSLISQLELTWRINHGNFPEGDWSQRTGDEAAMTQYRATLLAWARWARENPRSAAQLFDSVQKAWDSP